LIVGSIATGSLRVCGRRGKRSTRSTRCLRQSCRTISRKPRASRRSLERRVTVAKQVEIIRRIRSSELKDEAEARKVCEDEFGTLANDRWRMCWTFANRIYEPIKLSKDAREDLGVTLGA